MFDYKNELIVCTLSQPPAAIPYLSRRIPNNASTEHYAAYTVQIIFSSEKFTISTTAIHVTINNIQLAKQPDTKTAIGLYVHKYSVSHGLLYTQELIA